jgi:DNA-binding beta-propeller fold protein YncE
MPALTLKHGINLTKFFTFVFIGIFILSFSACSRKLTQYGESVVFPSPPDTARIQFLTKFTTSTDITGKRGFGKKFLLGELPSQPIVKPYGLSIHKGKIYVCDVGLASLSVIDLEKKSFEYFVPKGKGQLKAPINCFITDNGYLYIADVGRQEIVIFDSTSKYVSHIVVGNNLKPTDVFVDNDKIYVATSLGNRVIVYDRNSNEQLFTFPDIENGNEGHLYSPTNVYVLNDRVYVSDFGDFKVKIYDLQGNFISSVGSYGKNIGQFARPKGIAVDRDKNLFVVDAAFENVQIFNDEGKLLMFFGGSYLGPGYMWLPAKVMIDYNNLKYFRKYVDPEFDLKYLILVSNQYGPDKINVYGYIEPLKTKKGSDKGN